MIHLACTSTKSSLAMFDVLEMVSDLRKLLKIEQPNWSVEMFIANELKTVLGLITLKLIKSLLIMKSFSNAFGTAHWSAKF